MLVSISGKLGLPVHFQRYRSLFEMAMNPRHPKVLKVKPPRGICSLPEAFSFGGDPTVTQDFKSELTAVFRPGVAGHIGFSGNTILAEFASGESGNGYPTRD